MSIPVYVVSDDQLVDRSVLGDRLYEGTTAVVKEADHLAEVERERKNAVIEYIDAQTDRVFDAGVVTERERITTAVKALLRVSDDRSTDPVVYLADVLAAIEGRE